MKFQLLLFILLFSACNSTKKNQQFIDTHTSKNSLDWSGTYQGIIPSADSMGMETKLILNEDKTYCLKTTYQGKSKTIFKQNGAFKWNNSGNGITLYVDDKPLRNHQYFIIENGLIKLDRNGEKISGKLKDNYKLVKNTAASYNLKPDEYIFRVNSRKVACNDDDQNLCLQIKKNKPHKSSNWELFEHQIKGFHFEEGYLYHLIVREIILPEIDLSTDTSSITYELVEVIDKKIDNCLKLHNIWAIESIKGVAISSKKFNKHPQLEINLTTNKIKGNDGCNNFMGAIKKVSNKHFEINNLAGTKMACPNINLSNEINTALNQTTNYELKNRQLTLFDTDGIELLILKKVD